MQLTDELHHCLKSENFKKAYNIYSKMQARGYPQALLDASLDQIQKAYDSVNSNLTTYGFKNYLDVIKQDLKSITTHKFYSHIDEITEDLKVSGWCFSGIDSEKEASFLVCLKGQPYRIHRTSFLRGDISGIFKSNGFWGYEFNLPKDVQDRALENGRLKIEIRSPYGEAFEEKIATKEINFSLKEEAKIFPIKNTDHSINTFKTLNRGEGKIQPEPVSIILLNLNGGDIVIHSIKSIHTKMRPGDELIIVDHGSDDNSIEEINRICEKNSNIFVWERGKNYSFSESNNSAVKKARNEIIVFINNDIVIEDGCFGDLANALGQEKIEIVGGLLFDAPCEDFSIKNINTFPRCLQHRGIGIKIGGENFIQAYEINTPLSDQEKEINYLQVAATTGALMAMRKEFFLKIGGFNEKYIYGQEDVDICLRTALEHGSNIAVCNKLKALHYHGYTRLRQNSKYKTKGVRLMNNRIVLNKYFTPVIRKALKDKAFRNNVDPTKANRKKVAFIVSDLSINTSKGDVFTAYELANALSQRYGCECYFILPNREINCEKFDIIINFLHAARIDVLKNLRSETLVIAWMRNWFDKWCNLPDIDIYDIIYCSSKQACTYVEERIKCSVKYLPLAAGAEAIKIGKERKSKPTATTDKSYTFIGSYFNSKREITKFLDPHAIPYRFKLYGYNWENEDKFSLYTMGPVNYFDVVEKYLETNLVIDDANIATKKWGSVNCRVFDSLALGVGVITNGCDGANELFDGLLPTYDSKESLTAQITSLLERTGSDTTSTLQNIVLENHTYEKRADQIWNDIDELCSSVHIRIHTSIPKPNCSLEWGDLYLARAIRHKLQKDKLRCNISVGENDERRLSSREDLALNLRGIEKLSPINQQNWINWLISHPESYSMSELTELDNIAVASHCFGDKVEKLRSNINEIQPLYIPQFSTLKPSGKATEPLYDFIFVGNTRNVYRESVRYAIELGLNIKVIGSGWSNYIQEEYILDKLVSNSKLESAYKLGKVVLCDHWEDMKKFGFVSNRIYDCLCIGQPILTDYSKDIEADLTPEERKYIFTYNSFEEFKDQSMKALAFAEEIAASKISLNSTSAFKGLTDITDYVKNSLDQ